jgi:hypothetical protein
MPRRARGDHRHAIRLPPLAYEHQSFKTRRTSVGTTGRTRDREKKLPPPDSWTPPPQQMRPRRSGYEKVEAITSGTAGSLTGRDLLELRMYSWKGRRNKQARVVWDRIKDQIPNDSFFTRQLRESGNAGVYVPGTEPLH